MPVISRLKQTRMYPEDVEEESGDKTDTLRGIREGIGVQQTVQGSRIGKQRSQLERLAYRNS